MPQGSTQVTRIGNRIVIKKVQVRGYFLGIGDTAMTVATDEANNLARIIIAVDHQCNGSLPNPEDILSLTTSINSFRDLDNSDRFTILFDHTQEISLKISFEGTDGETTSEERQYPFQFFKNMNLLTQFDGTTADISSIVNNSIVCFGFVEDTKCAVGVFCNFRIRYTG